MRRYMRLKRHWDLQFFDAVSGVVIVHLGVVGYHADYAVVYEWRYWALFMSVFAWMHHRSLESEVRESSSDPKVSYMLLRKRSFCVWIVIIGMLSYGVAALFLPISQPHLSSVEQLIAIFYVILVGILITRKPMT